MSIDHTALKDIASAVAAVVGLLTFAMGVIEYAKQGRLKRAEFFLRLNERFIGNKNFIHIRNLIEVNDPKLADVPLEVRREYAATLEEAALFTTSGIIRPEISIYFFGNFAFDIWSSEHFWFGLEKDAYYWDVLRDYVAWVSKMNSTRDRGKWTYRF